MNFEVWREVLEYARWAPSPHNTQHWRFQLVDERRAVLLYDPARLLPIEDKGGRFMVATFGLVAELMSIAAAPLGFEVKVLPRDVVLDATADKLSPFADLELVKRSLPESFDRELIVQRRTSRLPYDDRPVDSDVMNALMGIAREYGHQLEYSTDPNEVAWVADLNAETMFSDLRDEPTRREIESWVRYSEAEARQQCDGLAAFAMRFPGWVMRMFFRTNWLFELPVVFQIAKWSYKRSMRGTRTVAWISGRFEEQADCISGGRMLARLWLTMTQHGVYLHPFGSVITNPQSHQRLHEHFANPERPDPLWLLLRLGHSEQPPRSFRLSLDEVIVR